MSGMDIETDFRMPVHHLIVKIRKHECIHTVQGYDLNYLGVIIGEDIKYDPVNKCIYADKDCYFDQQGKSGVANDPDALREYLLNIYITLMTRGIRGTYVYVCNPELREYMKQFIDLA